MVVQKDPEALENAHAIPSPQPPPPSYTEFNYPQIAEPEAAHTPQPPSYPPNSYTHSDAPQGASPPLTPQQQQARLGQEYQSQLLARCAEGDHDATTTFGICGIICAVLLFPIGFICLCIDTDTKCSRCGVRL